MCPLACLPGERGIWISTSSASLAKETTQEKMLMLMAFGGGCVRPMVVVRQNASHVVVAVLAGCVATFLEGGAKRCCLYGSWWGSRSRTCPPPSMDDPRGLVLLVKPREWRISSNPSSPIKAENPANLAVFHLTLYSNHIVRSSLLCNLFLCDAKGPLTSR